MIRYEVEWKRMDLHDRPWRVIGNHSSREDAKSQRNRARAEQTYPVRLVKVTEVRTVVR